MYAQTTWLYHFRAGGGDGNSQHADSYFVKSALVLSRSRGKIRYGNDGNEYAQQLAITHR